MNGDGYTQDELWAGLSRLYDATTKLEVATSRLLEIAQAHESRLDKLEVVQEWLARRERDREKDEGKA